MTPNESHPLRPRRREVLFGTLVFLSGMAALSHQLLWTRRLIDLLGASSESSARVFGTFFLGLSIGSAIAALLVARSRNPLRDAGLIQLSIPLLVVPVIYLSSLTDWIWPAIGAESLHGADGNFIKSILTLGFVLPPSTMMGLSFPLIVTGRLRLDHGGLGRSGINLYALNTIGGASGVLFTVMVSLPKFGNFASMVLAAVVDGVIGLVLLICARRRDFAPIDRIEQESGLPNQIAPTKPLMVALGLAFFSGMAVLALEVTAFQMFQLVATISLFSPAAVLFCAIASLGTAAAIFSRVDSALTSIARERTIVLVFAVSGLLVVLAPQIFMAIARRSNWFAENVGVGPFVFRLGAMALLSVGPAWLVAGLIFPFAIARAGEHCSSSQSGRRLGMLLAINGLGGLLGAELAYRVLLPAFGVYGAMAAIGFAFSLIALSLSLFSRSESVTHFSRFSATASIVLVLGIGLLNSQLPVVNPPPGVNPVDIQSGREGTVAVVVDRKGDRSILVANQYVLGGTAVRYDQERQVLLPLVLHQQPQTVGCIGLATGITPGAALSIDSVEDVTAIEISPLVAKAAETYFHEFNHEIFSDETASVVIGDGRTYIAAVPERFDVITGDLFLPWAPGTARLYSCEHFAAVRRALKAGGIFCQWLPMYQLTADQFGQIADTFANEFDETYLFMNHFRTTSPMVALVGGKEAACLDWERVRRRCERLRESNLVRDPVLRHESGIQLLYLGQWHIKQGETELVSLADPSLEYSAATIRLSNDPGKKYHNPTNWIRFCRSRAASQAKVLDSDSESQVSLMVLATGLLELDFARRTENKLAGSIAQRVAQTIPQCFVDDRLAEWDRWPGTSIIQQLNDRR